MILLCKFFLFFYFNAKQMTLQKIGLNHDPASPFFSTKDITLAFAFDRNYLELWKVAVYSLAYSENFLDSPITIYTIDKAVFEDPVVKLVADRLCLIEGNKREVLCNLAKHNVKRKERSNWNQGTFLKWAVFEKHSTSSALFLDVDMIFLKKFDVKLASLSSKPFVCIRQYHGEHKHNASKERISAIESEKNLKLMIDGSLEGFYPRSINSGFMLLGSEMLSDDFFSEISSFAEKSIAINEQRHFTNYFFDKTELIDFISYRYNFQESYLSQLDWNGQRRILKSISVLHYAGHDKPWKLPATAIFRPSTALWHWYSSMANKHFTK
jgi:lipopolysaccharide biosynthesis glycosyltransferase